MHLLALSGSLRQQSSNTSALKAAAILAPSNVTVEFYEGLGSLPHFNPDLDGDSPPVQVADLRRRIGAADGLLICSPEYARGVAGSFKNALDWLVSSSEFPDKCVAVINASQRATHADAALKMTLTTMSARLIEPACLTLPLLGRNLDAAGIAADPELSGSLKSALAAFVVAIKRG
jgi:NAD(P)H-dependent FMN reductase